MTVVLEIYHGSHSEIRLPHPQERDRAGNTRVSQAGFQSLAVRAPRGLVTTPVSYLHKLIYNGIFGK